MENSNASTKVGVSGHQHRDGIDWQWVKSAIRTELARYDSANIALTSLAVGSDQLFADVALELNIPVIAVLPMPNYERYFEGRGLLEFRRLLGRSEVTQLNWSGDPERAFFEAGKFIVDQSNVLIAIWDGQPTEGLGGTGDVVQYANMRKCRVIHINPITRKIHRYV